MKPTKQTVYLPVKVEDELPKPSKYLVIKEKGDKDFVYTPFSKDITHWLKPQEAFVFTPEQLNEYTQSVIKQSLETAVEKAYVTYVDLETNEEFDYTDVITDDGVGAGVNKKSITNTFEETYNKIKV